LRLPYTWWHAGRNRGGTNSLGSTIAPPSRSLGTERLTNHLLLAFAVTARMLAAVGIYGVMALGVSHRVNEFGIRLALGAAPGDVLALVLGQGMRLVLLGVTLGLAGAAGLTRFLGSLLFHVEPLDPATFGAVALVLAAVAFVACYLRPVEPPGPILSKPCGTNDLRAARPGWG
jgi:predicted lysophospholipase L1 biosynthesis ABC-type transport system permease subunit